MLLDSFAAGSIPCVDEHARRFPRAIFSVPVTLHRLRAEGVQHSRAISLDISEGGMGALVQGNLAVGEIVELDLKLQEGPLSAVAIVRHAKAGRSGFEFLGLTEEERRQIRNVAANG